MNTPAGSTTPAAPTPSGVASTQDSDQEFCAELKANGATGADFGTIAIFYPREALLKDVRGMLAAMGDATPPEQIDDEWRLQKAQLKKVEAAAKKLKPGGLLQSDPGSTSSDKVKQAQQTLTTYWFDHCA